MELRSVIDIGTLEVMMNLDTPLQFAVKQDKIKRKE